MPVIFRRDGFRFLFFSNEGHPREPVHIHVRKGEKIAKFWVEPVVSLEDSYNLTSTELTKLRRMVEENQELIVRAWHEHFGD